MQAIITTRQRPYMPSQGSVLHKLDRDSAADHGRSSRLCLRLFKDSLLFQEVINAGTHVFLAHLINSFWRLHADALRQSAICYFETK